MMGSRDKETKTLQDKLKQYFRKGSAGGSSLRVELVISNEIERELAPSTPLVRRLKLIKELTEKAPNARLQPGGVERVWACVSDLVRAASDAQARRGALDLLRALMDGQSGAPIMRAVLLRWLRDTVAESSAEDYEARYRLLLALTNGGRDITTYEEQMGRLLLEWLPTVEDPADAALFLQFVTSVVKFNAAHLDEDVVQGVVEAACGVCATAGADERTQQALALLEAVVCYSLLPPAALGSFVLALARTVNEERHCRRSWKVMRCVLGSDLGHLALLHMVRLLQAAGDVDVGLLRGAVFYVNMALWGARRVPSLGVSYLAVLPAFLHALSAAHPVVTYEVLLAVHSLCTRFSAELHEPAWDIVLQILATVLAQNQSWPEPNELIDRHLHAVLDHLEQLMDARQFHGDEEKALAVAAECAKQRPEASALRLVAHAWQRVGPTHGKDWLRMASRLAERTLRDELRPRVRVHALLHMQLALRRLLRVHEDELLSVVGLPALGWCCAESCGAVRAAGVRAAGELAAACAGEKALELLELVERLGEGEPEVELAAGEALATVLKAKLLRPPASHSARALLATLNMLDRAYRRQPLSTAPQSVQLRSMLFELLFSLRVNCVGAIGLAAEANSRQLYSPYLFAETQAKGAYMHSVQGSCVAPVWRMWRSCAGCVAKETVGGVVGGVVRALPLAVTLAPGGELDGVALALAGALGERSPLASPNELLSALSALAPQQSRLEPSTQQRVVRALLRYAVAVRQPSSHLAISALTLYTLETRDTMSKMLPEVLLDLSKISDTKLIAAPMLEFLSTLTRLPAVFSSFVEDQYMSVFAILLPYTNPSRYNHYVASLAHHVVAAWFLKCRLQYRRNFVRFIIHGLHNYIIMPFEEQMFRSNSLAGSNEDSSTRKRSSSLGSRRVEGGAGGVSASAAFHVELTETCVDLLARYSFSPCSVKAKRSQQAEFLLAGGQSGTWLVGHKLVSITTSGCAQHPLKHGLCERCAQLCKAHNDSDDSEEDEQIKRYSKRSLQHSRSTDASSCSSLSAPDLASRQSSTETSKSSEGNPESLSSFLQKADRLSKDVDSEEGWFRSVSAVCPCWCGRWAEVVVRAPAGDVAWLMRIENLLSVDSSAQDHLHDVSALLAPSLANVNLNMSESEVRSRSNSASSHSHTAHMNEHKPSSEIMTRRSIPPPHASTSPINIPGSPLRDKDDDSRRHPVRRSNSSPEMSSSWKLQNESPSPPTQMIVLPASTEPTPTHHKNKAKKELRVSCEAIPEEMSGTSPHPPLQTFSSDPGQPPATAALPPPEPDLPPNNRSKRSNTISVMSPTRRKRESCSPRSKNAGGGGSGGLSPAFVLLQLYQNMPAAIAPSPGSNAGPLYCRPLRVSGAKHERTVKSLDLIPPIETYKVGVVYVGPGQQDDETAILRNERGSQRYEEFVRALGTSVDLTGASQGTHEDMFLSVERGGRDGRNTCVWSDDATQLQFHVATQMPNSPRDPHANEKRKYIGNDYVSIAYNESGAPFAPATLKGQFNLAVVVLEPLERQVLRLSVATKDERLRARFLEHAEPQLVSDRQAPALARQAALHCSLAALIEHSLRADLAPYASNALERLRALKRLRQRLEAERDHAPAPAPYAPRTTPRAIDDFTDYT